MLEDGAPDAELRSRLQAEPTQVVPTHQVKEVGQREIFRGDASHDRRVAQAQVLQPGHQVGICRSSDCSAPSDQPAKEYKNYNRDNKTSV